jgi:hypothetical protein
MKKTIVTLGLIMGVFSFVYGIQEQPDVFMDGTKWKSLSMEVKMGYLMGFQEGLKISRTAVLLEKDNIEPEDPFIGSLNQIENWIRTYEVGDTRLGLIILTMDSVYSEDSNYTLIAAALVPLVTKRIRGEISDDDFNERLEKLKNVLK